MADNIDATVARGAAKMEWSDSDRHLILRFLNEPTADELFHDEELGADLSGNEINLSDATEEYELTVRQARMRLLDSAKACLERGERIIDPPTRRPDHDGGSKGLEEIDAPLRRSSFFSRMDASLDRQLSVIQMEDVVKQALIDYSIPKELKIPSPVEKLNTNRRVDSTPSTEDDNAGMRVKLSVVKASDADMKRSAKVAVQQKASTSDVDANNKNKSADSEKFFLKARSRRKMKQSILASAVASTITVITLVISILLFFHIRQDPGESEENASLLPSRISLPPSTNSSGRISLTFSPALIPTHLPTMMPTMAWSMDSDQMSSPTITSVTSTETPTTIQSTGPTAAPVTAPTATPTASPTIAPTQFPTSTPTAPPELYLFETIVQAMPFEAVRFNDVDSLQSRAARWLVRDPEFASYTVHRLLQRYAMVMLYLEGTNTGQTHVSLDGRMVFGLGDQNGWMSYTNECTWYSTADDLHPTCDSTNNIVAIDLEDVNLSGSVPYSLFVLSDQLQRLCLDKNQYSGTIPSEIGDLSRLVYLGLDGNDLAGSLPASIGEISNLESLILSGNDLTGAIPIEISRLSHLHTIRLERNGLVGDIPSEFGQLESLSSLGFHKNNLVGEVPGAICNISTVIELTADCDEVLCECCTYCCYECSPDGGNANRTL